MLKETDMTVTEIAGQCGFSSASYFTEMFHREYGMTPVDFRKAEQEEV
jgi:AraC-like DNA-binding protein